jgi:hypothetical protein
MNSLILSRLSHTWLIDVDGTILRHNGHLLSGDELLPGVKAFWESIPCGDVVVLLSARTEEERASTLDFMQKHQLRVDYAIFGLPKGERVLINDAKPKGMKTAMALNVPRDQGLSSVRIDLSDSI